MGGAAGRGSMTIGRAVALCLRNIGGQRAGETTKSVFGQPARFGFCIGEWEERSPWPSLAERRGFTADEDVVTVHGGKGTFPMADIHNDDAARPALPDRQEHGLPAREHVPRQRRERRGRRRVQPDVGRTLRRRVPRRRRPASVPPRATRGSRSTSGPRRTRRCCATRAASTGDGRVHLVERPDQIVPIVCGGLGSLHAIVLPSFGESRCRASPSSGP